MPVSSVQEVFDTHLPNRLKNKSDLVAKINATYKFVVTGDQGGTWLVDLTQPGGVVSQGDGEARCTVTVSSGDFIQLINGGLNPQMAFMMGKLKVSGDMGLALKLGSLLG